MDAIIITAIIVAAFISIVALGKKQYEKGNRSTRPPRT